MFTITSPYSPVMAPNFNHVMPFNNMAAPRSPYLEGRYQEHQMHISTPYSPSHYPFEHQAIQNSHPQAMTSHYQFGYHQHAGGNWPLSDCFSVPPSVYHSSMISLSHLPNFAPLAVGPQSLTVDFVHNGSFYFDADQRNPLRTLWPAQTGYQPKSVAANTQKTVKIQEDPKKNASEIRKSRLCDFQYAVLDRNLKKVQKMISDGVDVNDIDTSIYWQKSSLMYAVLTGDTVIVKMLIDHGANLDYADREGNTVMHHVSKEYNINDAIINLLIASGASVDLSNEKGETPLMEAAHHGNQSSVLALIKGAADVNARNKKGLTPFLHAITGRDRSPSETCDEMMMILKTHGANINAVDDRCMSALMYAVKNNKPKTVGFLLSLGVDPDLFNEEGKKAEELVDRTNPMAIQIRQWRGAKIRQTFHLIMLRKEIYWGVANIVHEYFGKAVE